MISQIREEVRDRQISRLCHFTPSRNLAQIAFDATGILATAHLKADERRVFTPTDLKRLDGYEGYVCCSVEYPNGWYFDVARSKDALFKDWVVLFITPEYLWAPGTRFCPRNAASGYGSAVAEGPDAFLTMFAPRVEGASGRTFVRSSVHLSCCPTDDQAEVLIPDHVARQDILGVGVRDESQAKNELARLRLAGVGNIDFKFVIAPILYDKVTLSSMIRAGKRPPESPWTPNRTA